MTTTEYDLIVIGAGAIGENVADRAVQGGLRTALVESELVGGECSYWACMPSKALLRSGSVLRAARSVEGAKEAVTGDLDVAAVLKRRNSFTKDWNDESQADWVASAGIDLIRGYARFVGPRQIEVTGADGTTTRYSAKHAITVSTGSAALLPNVPGLAEACPWTSREATSAQAIPPRLSIIGGGVVAVEMATAYASLGSAVMLIARGGILEAMEPFAGELVGASLTDLGVTLRLHTSPASVDRLASGDVVVHLDDGSTVIADELLVATGRTPRTEDLGLETIGLTPGEWLRVDDTLRVVDDNGEPFDGGWLYATGDVNHRALLTHQGKYQARAAGDVIAARARGREVLDEPWGAHVATADHQAVPQVTFSDPEVASVGLTAAAAEKAGYRTRVVDYEIGNVAGASVHADGYKGTARMVVDEDRRVILGVTFVGPDVGEMLHAATIAVTAEVPLDRLWHAVPAYPTMNEIWLRLLETYGRPVGA
ncbi:NAD(P)/FAD-dependent oxidoreductase [Agreia sp. VKM Ac-1783]|uniref:dihydrolipoyl dehydrogenase family protein n=1 Tax=Agreia sp. VKM Ac-1783 TaxID=1938889 RepID=UPI000A2AC7F2|nr:NAD(P)/FAD-dependent oxidoreductase [Agreia sp. VKM Ac-1783]SMQ68095.1 dihydrolipoamide dehydrogenase [Agreia sp. VKM Ac-1783]